MCYICMHVYTQLDIYHTNMTLIYIYIYIYIYVYLYINKHMYMHLYIGSLKHLVYHMERICAISEAARNGNDKIILLIDYDGYRLGIYAIYMCIYV
jgi:hypothetical protein